MERSRRGQTDQQITNEVQKTIDFLTQKSTSLEQEVGELYKQNAELNEQLGSNDSGNLQIINL